MIALLLIGCSHLPPATLAPNAEARGRALLERCVEAHGGLEAFAALGDVSMRIEDRWHAARLAPEQPGDPLVVYNVALQKGVATFAASDERWGHDSVQAWEVRDGALSKPERPLFFPSYGYFFSLPFKLLDPGVRHQDLGMRDGVHEVMAAFEEKPGRNSDIYVLRLDPQTHRLRSMLGIGNSIGLPGV